ncbi:glyoxalase/bleomycin resistance protein/dioxygenase superfamily protein [Actinocorallia herbida]|uniref:Glyoxalase/bleomycin resistance protein/dioxygenase superfamily protein n=1 Tax=Actinocorallia herbida TaxID=58109 RepID=A0A3N1CTP1_9ACTN|nr:VOC family protein [Actinocorallia herbida]ROO84682.1 glyoxalase/bleomycin resistance protein/dioxygenase superfamily protein [Actinocorallia herbida]
MHFSKIARALALGLVPVLALAFPGAGMTEDGVERPRTGPLGAPDHVGFAVADIDAAVRQLRIGTGNRFTQIRTTQPVVAVAGFGSSRIEMRRARTLRGSPHLELIESDAPGPWSATPAQAKPFLSYTVTDVDDAASRLANAGFQRVADSGAFAFWKGAGGVLVQLIENSAAPTGQDAGQPPGIDLGAVRNVSILPCPVTSVRTQVSAVSGISFSPEVSYDMPWQLSNGSSVFVHETVSLGSTNAPYVSIVTQAPALPDNACTTTSTPFYPVFLTGDVPAAGTQLDAAGWARLATANPMVSLHRASGISVEIAHTSFLP